MTDKKEIPQKSKVFVVRNDRVDEGILLANGISREMPSKYMTTQLDGEGNPQPVFLDANPRLVFTDRVEALRCLSNEIKADIQAREKMLFDVQTELSKEIRKSWKKDDGLSL
jgi:hypothetical protein